MAGAFASACGRIGYDPELVGPYGSKLDASADQAVGQPADARNDVEPEASNDTGASPDSNGGFDAGPMTSDAGDASFRETGGICPTSLALSGSITTPLRGGMGGVLTNDTCPAGHVIFGFAGATGTDGIISTLQTLCVLYNIVATPISCEFSAVRSMALARRGDPLAPGTMWRTTCPFGQAVTGIRGRAMSALDQLAVECAPMSVSTSAEIYRVSLGSATAQPAQGGTGGFPFDDACPVDTIANGIVVRAGAVIDALAISCATPTLLP